MESIQSQINTLIQKIDLVYQILVSSGDRSRSDAAFQENQLDRNSCLSMDPRIGDEPKRVPQNLASYPHNGYANLPSGANYRYDTAEWVIAEQDISLDRIGTKIVGGTSPVENRHQIREQDLSPQIQIQRLTAQLTVAYNRIAALEEQLLAKRWK